jgi:hypothetical protein
VSTLIQTKRDGQTDRPTQVNNSHVIFVMQ